MLRLIPGRMDLFLAATNKCLAQSNKSPDKEGAATQRFRGVRTA